MIETTKIQQFLFLNAKNKLIIRNVEIKKEAKNVIFWFLKKTYKRRKRHCTNGIFSISKFIEMKGVVILVKVEEMSGP